MLKLRKSFYVFTGCGLTVAGVFLLGNSTEFRQNIFGPVVYDSTTNSKDELAGAFAIQEEKIEHIKTPEPLRAIYMTSWVAGTTDWRAELIKFIDSSEINALVIDVKDYSGRIFFELSDPILKELGAEEIRVSDFKELIKELHQKNIYVIARISVFQDPYMAKRKPDLAVKNSSGGVWKDRKGISWIDPAAREYWDYIARLARETERLGFDELNFDYIRFPSDGNMQNISYDHWDEVTRPRDIMLAFYSYLDSELADLEVPISADLFGMVTSNYDDLNIGQVLEYAAPYFDYIAPMVYPSHYPSGFIGLANPAAHPYEVINYAMTAAYERLVKASSSPFKLRPWIQDFDLGANYDESMINKQKQAIYDAGLTSWMAWDPANKYTRSAYYPQ